MWEKLIDFLKFGGGPFHLSNVEVLSSILVGEPQAQGMDYKILVLYLDSLGVWRIFCGHSDPTCLKTGGKFSQEFLVTFLDLVCVGVHSYGRHQRVKFDRTLHAKWLGLDRHRIRPLYGRMKSLLARGR